VRTIRFLSLASVGGADQTALRSAASAATWTGDSDGSDVEASCAAILVSISPTRVSALFPSQLQFRRDQPVLRIDGVVLPECPIGAVARRLEVAHQRLTNLIAAAGRLCFSLDSHTQLSLPVRQPSRRHAIPRKRCSVARHCRANPANRNSAECYAWRLCSGPSACVHNAGSGQGRRVKRRRASALRDVGLGDVGRLFSDPRGCNQIAVVRRGVPNVAEPGVSVALVPRQDFA
jgi:hypothetical protein